MTAAIKAAVRSTMKFYGASSSATIGAKIVANFDIVTHTPQAVEVKIVG